MHRSSLLTALTAAAALTVAAPALATAPANDDVKNAFLISPGALPSPKNYTVNSAGTETGEKVVPGGSGSTVWFKWTPNGTGAAYADVCDSVGGPHYVKVFRLRAGQQPAIAQLDPVGLQHAGNPVASTLCRARFHADAKSAYYVQIDGSDTAEYAGVVRVKQDTSPPAPPALAPLPALTGTSVTASFTVGDDVVATACGIGQVAAKPCAPGTVLSALPGPAALVARAFDAMGNGSGLASRQFVADGSAPSTVIAPPPATVPFDAPPAITFAVHDDHPGATASCRIDEGAWAPCSSPVQTPSLPAGPHLLEVRSTDAVGNAEAAPARVQWTTLPPQTTDTPRGVVVVAGPACTLKIAAPKRVSRRALKRGLRKAVRVRTTTTGGCKAKVSLRRRGKKVAVVVTAGSLKRTATVKVR